MPQRRPLKGAGRGRIVTGVRGEPCARAAALTGRVRVRGGGGSVRTHCCGCPGRGRLCLLYTSRCV
ncbi:hypothetical protein [Streptomyces fragilis]|uniref:hypothetical protein n=1 Tax=Streptomyces fragilis TaxID=67301 RepID=UPI0024DEA044|nr:hypothetical protein [Streptomyces fragilis]